MEALDQKKKPPVQRVHSEEEYSIYSVTSQIRFGGEYLWLNYANDTILAKDQL